MFNLEYLWLFVTIMLQASTGMTLTFSVWLNSSIFSVSNSVWFFFYHFRSVCVSPVAVMWRVDSHVVHSSNVTTSASAARPVMSSSECSFTPVLSTIWASSSAKMSLMKHLKVILYSQMLEYALPSQTMFGWFHVFFCLFVCLNWLTLAWSVLFFFRWQISWIWKSGIWLFFRPRKNPR